MGVKNEKAATLFLLGGLGVLAWLLLRDQDAVASVSGSGVVTATGDDVALSFGSVTTPSSNMSLQAIVNNLISIDTSDDTYGSYAASLAAAVNSDGRAEKYTVGNGGDARNALAEMFRRYCHNNSVSATIANKLLGTALAVVSSRTAVDAAGWNRLSLKGQTLQLAAARYRESIGTTLGAEADCQEYVNLVHKAAYPSFLEKLETTLNKISGFSQAAAGKYQDAQSA